MNVDKNSISQYLSRIQKSINENQYRIEMNKNRKDNILLFEKYVIDELKAKMILLDLTYKDFCKVEHNKNKGFEHEFLFFFGKEIKLLERFGKKEVIVKLYIKIVEKKGGMVIVISFHEQKYPVKYFFKKEEHK